MKTLKKVLAVVLALAMVLGMAVTASAGYKDAEKVTYKEAVAVMSLAGVLNGYPDGTFQPQGTLTRAEAAKMIVYTLGLEDTSLGYKANFGDINGHWAETPISVAAGLGIVAGMGNGQFVPNGTLTGFQWAKILLCAMGYDAEIEGMLGAGWEAKVAKLMKAVGMDDDLKKFDGSKAVTREEAAQMIFNVLETGFVGYPEAGVKAVTLGSNYYTGRKAKYGEEDSFAKRLKLTKSTDNKDLTDDADAWGRPGTTWYVNEGKKTEDDVFVVAEADASYTVETKECVIYDDLDLEEKATKFDYFLNGEEQKDDVEINDSESQKQGAQGQLIEFYVGDFDGDKEDEYIMVAIDTYLAKVTKVKAAKFDKKDHLTNKAALTLDVYKLGEKTIESKTDFDYEKGDYVLVNINAKDVDDSEIIGIAEATAAKLTKVYAKWDKVGVAGEEEKTAVMFKDLTGGADLKSTYDFFYDQYGNVIAMMNCEVVTDYYVVDYVYEDYVKSATHIYASIVGLDAEAQEVELDKADARAELDFNLFNKEKGKGNSDKGLVSFIENEDGVYEINAVAAQSPAGISLKNGKKFVKNLENTYNYSSELTEETVFLFETKAYSESKEKAGTYEAYVGYDEVPSFTTATPVSYVRDDAGKVAIIFVRDAVFSGDTKYVFVKENTTPTSVDGDDLFEYTVYAGTAADDFKKTTVVSEDANLFKEDLVPGQKASESTKATEGIYKLTFNADEEVLSAEKLTEVDDRIALDDNDSDFFYITVGSWDATGTHTAYDVDKVSFFLLSDLDTEAKWEDVEDLVKEKKIEKIYAYGPYTSDPDDFVVTTVIIVLKPEVSTDTTATFSSTSEKFTFTQTDTAIEITKKKGKENEPLPGDFTITLAKGANGVWSGLGKDGEITKDTKYTVTAEDGTTKAEYTFTKADVK